MRILLISLMLLTLAMAPAPAAHVSVGATIVPERGILNADVTIRPGPVEAGEQLTFILGEHFLIMEADAGPHAGFFYDATSSPWPGLQRITVNFYQAEAAPAIRLRYEGRPNPGGELPINMISPDLVELSLDGMWIPIRQDLGLPFTLSASISGIPGHYNLVSQGEVVWRDGVFGIVRSTPGIDFPLAAAPGLQRINAGRFELVARNPQSAQAQLYRNHGPRALDYLERWFGGMPGAPARLVVVERPRRSGYARAGYIVFTETGEVDEIGSAKFVAHEFAHAWFRNANATSEHRWLDESTAEYVALRYVEQALGAVARDTLLAPKRAQAATAGPILGFNRGDPELYAKGPLLLLELEQRIGRARIDALLARVAAERIGETPAFLQALADIGGPETAGWFATRLRS